MHRSTSSPTGRHLNWAQPALLLAIITLSAIGFLAPAARSSEQTQDEIADTRDLLNQWVDVRKNIADQKRRWAESKEFLDNRIELVQQEIDSLRGKIADLKKNITETDTKRDALQQEKDRLETASQSLVDTIGAMETRCKKLLGQMPNGITGKVQILSQQIPADPAKTDLSVSQRFQNVLGILNTLNKSSRDINVASEIRDLPDGTSAEVMVMYLGLSRAYYVSANGKLAGTGNSDGKAWVWTADNAIAPQVAQAIAIFKNEQPATFVKLPVTFK